MKRSTGPHPRIDRACFDLDERRFGVDRFPAACGVALRGKSRRITFAGVADASETSGLGFAITLAHADARASVCKYELA
jgi:hypothetical protein